MISDTIEREILVDAPVEVVWKVVTEPEHIVEWFSDEAALDLRPGGEGVLTFGLKATNQQAVQVTVRLTVEVVEPPNRFVYRWDYPEGVPPRAGNSLLVEFSLTDQGGKTLLRVAESGFAALDRPIQEKVANFNGHTSGWDVHVARLRDYVGGRS